MITNGHDLARVCAAMLYSGVFWTMVWFTLARSPADRGSRVAAALIMVLAVYLFMGMVLPGEAG